jgi:hypothetical protein
MVPVRRASRVITVLSMTAFLAVLGFIATSWKDIAIRYHLHRLRGEPAYLQRMLLELTGSAGRGALEEYARSVEGKPPSMRTSSKSRDARKKTSWVDRAEFGSPRRTSSGWSVRVWRTSPRATGGHATVRIDEQGNVTGYLGGR